MGGWGGGELSGTVMKRCACGEAKWTKCTDPWYLRKFMWQGTPYQPNLTRYAGEVLHREIRTKAEAEEVADLVRAAIRAGTYVSAKATRRVTPPTPPVNASATWVNVTEDFLQLVVRARNIASWQNERGMLAAIGNYLKADTNIADISQDQLTMFFNTLNKRGVASSTWNKYLTVTKRLFRWASRRFSISNPTDEWSLRRRKHAQRREGISEGPEAKLLMFAEQQLHDCIIALVETGLRIGELLALRRQDVQLEGRRLEIRAIEEGARKTGQSRQVHISERLFPVISRRCQGLQGVALKPTAYVFGNEVGEKVGSIKKAWETCLLRAHGHKVQWAGKNGLSAECRAQLKQINKHIHDLRHEAGLRWHKGGVPLNVIQRLYGHETLEQTSTYLGIETGGVIEAMAAYDSRRVAQAKESAKPRQSGYNLGTNAKYGRQARSGSKVVKFR
jgi:integrase